MIPHNLHLIAHQSLKILPVSDFKTRDIEKISKDLIKLYKDKLAWDLAIEEMRAQLKPEIRSLTYLEKESLRKRQTGKFDEAWFNSVTWKVDLKTYELTSSLQAYVELKTTSSSNMLTLYFSSKDDPKVIPIVELKIKDKTLAVITLISLHDLKYPRKESLEHFIKDIEIFTLKPDIWEKSKNIYAYLKNYLKTEFYREIEDFPDLINEILNKECLLEALVIKNYNIESIIPITEFLDMFPLNEIIKNKIIKFYIKL